MVFRYAIATGRAERDPSVDLRGALTAPTVKHRATILDPAAIGALLRAIEGFDGQPTTRAALRLAPMVFVRPGELRHAEWTEFDLEKAVWTIPAEKMKMRRPHRVPLSRQVVSVLNELKAVTGEFRWLFPSVRTIKQPISRKYPQLRIAPPWLRTGRHDCTWVSCDGRHSFERDGSVKS